jgi:hypothetical protein
LLFALVAALLGLKAATMPVRDSMDDFMADLRKQGRWTSFAAGAAAVSVLAQAIERFFP